MKLLKFLAPLLLAVAAVAQLPAPSFPPITFNHYRGSGDCFRFQYNIFPAEAQKSGIYTFNPGNFWAGNWVTHETWCEAYPTGNYTVWFFLDTHPRQFVPSCGGSFLDPALTLGAPFAPGYNRLFLLEWPIVLPPTHQRVVAGVVRYQLGFHLDPSLIGYDIITQWARFDVNGMVYAGNMNGYTVNM